MATLKGDTWIKQLGANGGITPFVSECIKEVTESGVTRKVLSYGTESSGYCPRLSPKDFRVMTMPKDSEGQHYIDPKKPNMEYYTPVELQFEEGSGSFFMLPAFSYGLGVAVECVDIPSNITVLCLGKSTYARAGVICNVTPGEPSWRGHFTLEFMNAGPLPCRLYANEGIIRFAFVENDEPEEAYNRKYQGQGEEVVLGKMEPGI